ncbi:MAG TPA: 6-pyruvoyl-tetrahydropterin synthase-related protein [Pyrinomonadaceae bacterium]|nr:6-pyruvoyl-tetrahydropterin synthase-related protein [Pyrinomonadaceae bacterium]
MAFVVGVSILAMAPMMVFGVPSNLDLSNHFRFALPFHDALAAGNVYAGWLAESNAGYGDPSFRFYPPGLYYLLSLFKFATGDWYVATILAFTLISVIGGLGMYLWARSVLSDSQAMWVGAIYAFAPYHLNQLYQATLLAEWAASSVLPFVFAFVDRVCTHGRRRDVAGLAASYAVLVLTHVPLTVIGSVALLVYALARIHWQRGVQTVLKLSAGAALGLCASSIYWVTTISELKWIGLNDVAHDNSVDYRFNFLFSTFSPDYLNVWWMNILAVMTLLLTAPVILLLRRAKSEQQSLRSVAVLTVFAVFMAVPLSRPVWMLRPLQETQFPWRWLAVISMGAAILTAAAIPRLIQADENSARIKRLVIVGAMSIAVVFTLSHVVREAKFLPPADFQKTLAKVRGTSSIDYWLPVWASSTAQPMAEQVEAAGRSVSVESWTPENRRFRVAAGEAIEARVRTFYYPHWKARSAGQLLNTRPDKDGVLLISLPANAATVDLAFEEPRRSRVSAVASFAAFAFIGVLAIPLRRKQ